MIFMRDSLRLSAVSFLIAVTTLIFWIFSYCPLSHVSHVTLANWQGFGFEFHLRPSQSAFTFSEYMDISRPADYFIACFTVLTRAKKLETAVHGRNSCLSVWTISCRCPVKFFLRSISLASLSAIISILSADQTFYRSGSIFVCGPLHHHIKQHYHRSNLRYYSSRPVLHTDVDSWST